MKTQTKDKYIKRKEFFTETLQIWLGMIALAIISLIMLLCFSSASFISPIENQTYNTTIITLNYNLSEVPTDFYYIVNNNTDGTERVYPTENLTEYFALEGINQVYVVYIINDTEFNDSIVFYVNTSVENKSNETTITPILTPPSSSHSSGGGGGSCTTKWECSNWSECASNNLQSRVCSYKTNYCKPTSIKPNETQGCNYSPQDKTIGASGSIPDVSVMANSSVDKTADTQTQKNFDWSIIFWIIAGICIVIVFYNIIKQWRSNETENTMSNSDVSSTDTSTGNN
jgi:hypothetical protein